MPLHSLSELERASLQEIALYQLQEKLLLGDLSLAKGREWVRMATAEGGELSHSCCSSPFPLFLTRDVVYGKAFVTHFGPFYVLFPALV